MMVNEKEEEEERKRGYPSVSLSPSSLPLFGGSSFFNESFLSLSLLLSPFSLSEPPFSFLLSLYF